MPTPPPSPEPRAAQGSPFDPALAPAGRIHTLLCLWALFLLSSLPFLARLLRGDTHAYVPNVLLTSAFAFLLALVWRGQVWAWRVVTALAALLGLVNFMGGMFAGTTQAVGWLISAVGLAFIALALCLVALPTVRAFLDTRWAARGQA